MAILATCRSATTTGLRLMEVKKKSNLEEVLLEEEEEEEGEGESRMIENETEYLTPDAIYEILTRVSLGTLLCQCRLVCKDWQNLIYDKKFQHNHSQRTPMASGYFLQRYLGGSVYHISFIPCVSDPRYTNSPRIPSSPSLDFLPTSSNNNIMIGGSSPCGSLLCCVDKPLGLPVPTYYVCKPATREWRKIPNPRTKLSTVTMRIVIMKQSYPMLHYKIIRLSKASPYGYHGEIFDSSNWSWKRLEDTGDFFLGLGSGVLVNGCLHWLTRDSAILVFNVNQENWTTMELPPISEDEEHYWSSRMIVHCEGKVGMFYTTLDWMELWVLENYNTTKPTWIKKYRNDLRSLFHKNGYCYPEDMYSNDVAFVWNRHELIWYNCNNDTYATTKFQNSDSQGGKFFAFHQSQSNYL